MSLEVSALVELARLVVIIQVLVKLVRRVGSIVASAATAQQVQISMRGFYDGHVRIVGARVAQLTSDRVQSGLTRAVVRKGPGLLKINAILVSIGLAAQAALAYVRGARVAVRVVVVAERGSHVCVVVIQSVMERSRVVHGVVLLIGLSIGKAHSLRVRIE